MKRAFTLIELLVVIAIIAILAAILFPVFAQAKAAAKKTASLSNIKQTGTGVQIYLSDSDDVLPVPVAWDNSGARIFLNGVGYKPWSFITQPYIKNDQLLTDPQATPNLKPSAGFDANLHNLVSPQYGYNSTYIAPLKAVGSTVQFQPMSATGVARAAETVLLAQKFSSAETDNGGWYCGYWFGAGSYCSNIIVDPPDCGSNSDYCFEGWNDNTFWGGAGGIKYLRNVEAAGAFTGGASMRGAKNMVVGWLDGHASSKPAGAMAVGTSYNGAKNAAGLPTQNSSAITITEPARYLWKGDQ